MRKPKVRQFQSITTGDIINSKFIESAKDRYRIDFSDDDKTVTVEWEEGETEDFIEI